MRPESTIALRSGNRMPVLGLGTWQLTDDTAGTVDRALELGYRMIDTSGDYGTQPGIGEALRRHDRDAVYVVTKVEETDEPREAMRRNLEELALERADLALIHRPPPVGAGEELWEGLIEARREGLATDIGVSNYSIEQLRAIAAATDEMPAVNQIEWSPFGHSEEMQEFCRTNGIVLQAWSPLTRGERLDDATLRAVAKRHGKTPAEVLIRWNLERGTVPLPKANRIEHLEENLGVFDFELDRQDMTRLNGLNEHYSSLSFLPYV